MRKLGVAVAVVALAAVPVLAQQAAKEKKVDITGTCELTVDTITIDL